MKWNFKRIMAAPISGSAPKKTMHAWRSVAIFHGNFLVPSILDSGPLIYQYISLSDSRLHKYLKNVKQKTLATFPDFYSLVEKCKETNELNVTRVSSSLLMFCTFTVIIRLSKLNYLIKFLIFF